MHAIKKNPEYSLIRRLTVYQFTEKNEANSFT